MNYHNNEWIMRQINRHYNYALTLYNEKQIIGIFCQGSQNYGLDLETSDIDTKCLLTPSFKDICLDRRPVSTTHILDNEEHLDAKDVRSYVSCFRKQNLNFLEILFTDYYIVNPLYEAQWNRLIAAREQIAHMNPFRAVKSMKGIALEKYHAMEHMYPSKVKIIERFGYDPKQLHHLVRVDNYLTRYINGESYKSCLVPEEKMRRFLLDIKKGNWELGPARVLAYESLAHIEKIANEFCAWREEQEDEEMRELLEDVSYEIMKISVKKEILC